MIPMKFYNCVGKNTIQNENIPELAGVYFIWSNSELLYIGSTDNLRKRIAQHLSYAFLKQHLINPDEAKKVSIIFTRDRFDALRIEEQLINLIPTKWNRNPFYKLDWYNDWREGTGIFAVKDKQNEQSQRGGDVLNI